MLARVLIIDDHPLMRDALALALSTMNDGYHVTTASTLAGGMECLRSEPPDVVLLDLGLPGCNGLDGLRSLLDAHPEVPVVIVSATDDRRTILSCLEGGASGFIPKTASREVMIGALRLVIDGGTYIPAEAVVNRTAEPIRLHDAAIRTTVEACATDPRQLGLTERQIDVLRLILKGLPNKLICRQLELAEGTVKVHVSAVLRALGVRSRTQAVVAASRMGLRVAERRGIAA